MTAAITFDTLWLTRTRGKTGLPTPQAEAIATAFTNASGEAGIAIERNIKKFEFKLDKETTVIKWMLGLSLAGVMPTVMKAFF